MWRPKAKYTTGSARHKHKLHKLYLDNEGVPDEFSERLDEWKFLCEHFVTPEFQAASKHMTGIRGSENKINHTSGPTPFNDRARLFKDAQSPAPYVDAYCHVYEQTTPEKVAIAREAANAELDNLRATQSAPLEATADTAESILHLTVDSQISVLERVVGNSRGTTVRGLGRVPIRSPKKRGPTKGTPKGPVVDEEIRSLREQLAEDRQQRELEREEERRQRELEREEERRQREEEKRANEERVNKLLALFEKNHAGPSLH